MSDGRRNNRPPRHTGPGRPTEFRPEYIEIAKELCTTKGFTNKQLAKRFGVHKATIYDWKNRFPEFGEAVRKSKDFYDSDVVECAMLKRALGYDYDEVTEERVIETDAEGNVTEKLVVTKIVHKHLAGDVRAQMNWLANRLPDRWRDIHNADVNITNLADLIKLVHGRDGNGEKFEPSDIPLLRPGAVTPVGDRGMTLTDMMQDDNDAD